MAQAPRPERGHSPIHSGKRRKAKDQAVGALPSLLDALEAQQGPPPPVPSRDPFEWILWENVAYLVSDDKRHAAFGALKQRIGTEPEKILAASPDALGEIAELGGMHPRDRAAKLVDIAEIAMRDFAGDVKSVLKRPAGEAQKALQKFPGIGAPGAEKILLLTSTLPVLALDSNALRVLTRLGFGEEKKSYDATYRSAQEAAAAELPKDCRLLIRAHQLLRRHGQEICRRSAPRCEACAVSSKCRFYARQRVT